MVYANTVEYAEHIALVKGDVSAPGPVLVRMHAVNLLDDMLGDARRAALHAAMRMIARGAAASWCCCASIGRPALSDRVRLLAGPAPAARELRDYGIGAQILLDLGVQRHGPAVQHAPHDRRAWKATGSTSSSSGRSRSGA